MWKTYGNSPPGWVSYFSLPHFSLGKKSKRKMWERKIREAYWMENFRSLALVFLGRYKRVPQRAQT
ncbi:MAG: hypothetical protein ACREA2_24700, partial [Blastocatellia bacterium]